MQTPGMQMPELSNRVLNAILIVAVNHMAATILMLLIMHFSFIAHVDALADCLMEEIEERLEPAFQPHGDRIDCPR